MRSKRCVNAINECGQTQMKSASEYDLVRIAAAGGILKVTETPGRSRWATRGVVESSSRCSIEIVRPDI